MPRELAGVIVASGLLLLPVEPAPRLVYARPLRVRVAAEGYPHLLEEGVHAVLQKDTAQRVCGLKEQSNPKTLFGITDTETVKLDFDDTPLDDVNYWAKRVYHWFKLDGFLILKSNESSYHVVFDLPVSWELNVHIMNWVAVECQLKKLSDYVLMQGIKESSTLRVGNKGGKKPPKIKFRFGKQCKQVKKFLEKRKEIQILKC